MITETLASLGLHAEDRVTGFTGVATTIGFDLYGCVQVVLTPSHKKGELPVSQWFDIGRLVFDHKERAMDAPTFSAPNNDPSKFPKGPSIKPDRR
jgi:hypothetical protein